jgi:glycosyltransferase involved in cell wall biosynthesis
MSRPVRVLVVRPSKATFIEDDIALLRKHYTVRTLDVFEKRRSVLADAKVLLRLLRGVVWADVTYSWFVDVYALWAVRLSKMLLRKSIVVVGGYEVADVPEADYGLLRSPKKAKMVKKTLRGADNPIAVSDLVEREVRALSPGCGVKTVHLGIDCGRLVPSSAKERLVVTVASMGGRSLTLKGVEVFARASLSIPDADFRIVGSYDDDARKAIAAINPGITLEGTLPHDDLMALLDRTKVYCQLSVRESFGMALAEAMAFRCVPVITDAGAMREVVGDAGYIVPVGDHAAAAEAIGRALSSDGGDAARERICTKFPLGRREDSITRIIKGLVECFPSDIDS